MADQRRQAANQPNPLQERLQARAQAQQQILADNPDLTALELAKSPMATRGKKWNAKAKHWLR